MEAKGQWMNDLSCLSVLPYPETYDSLCHLIVKTQEINHAEIPPHTYNINIYIYCRESHEAYSTNKQT